MPNQVIATPDAPQSKDYSQAVKAGNTIYVAGTTGIDVATGEFAGPTFEDQARQALLNVQTILRAAGAELADVVMVHTLLARTEHAGPLCDVFEEFFPDVRPPRCISRIGVEREGLLVSLAVVAVIDSNGR
jgi:2-iminobutanoate/2-iminopropanoate deaminase